MTNWYCWFCETILSKEEVYKLKKNAGAKKKGEFVYNSRWGTIHTARKTHWYKIEIVGVEL